MLQKIKSDRIYATCCGDKILLLVTIWLLVYEETTNTREKHFQVFNKSSIDVNKIDAAGIRHDNENELYFRQRSG